MTSKLESNVKRARPPRIAFYTHDTFGMGHVRRCLNLIEAMAIRRPDAAILRDGIFDALRQFYDRILVFGESSIFDARREYRFDAATAAKVRHGRTLLPRNPNRWMS